MDIIRRPPKDQQYVQTEIPHFTANRSNTNGGAGTEEVEMLDEYITRTRITDKKKTVAGTKKRGMKIFWVTFIIFIVSVCSFGYIFYKKADHALEQISDSDSKHSVFTTISNIANPSSYENLAGFDDGRINILLLGRANSHKSGKDLTDTIMIASINTKDYTVGLFSLPRDLLVSNGDFYVKINSRYQSGLRQDKGAELIIDSVEEITDQRIHYYIVMDFEGFIDIIDTLDGINVDVPHHIRDTRYPGPGYSYETFEVYPGLQKFDGETALKYARTRHDVEGDFGRAKRQQQIMQAARNKAFSLGTIVHPTRITQILATLGEHMHTNITPHEVEPFISLIKKVDTHNITNVVVDAWKPGSLLISARYYSESGGISGLVPRIGNYKEIREHARNLFDMERITQRKRDIAAESPTSIMIINESNSPSITNRVRKMLSTIGFDEIQVTESSDSDVRETTVVTDNTNGDKPFSLDEIIKKIPAQRSQDAAENNDQTDFVVILGNDIVKTYTYTEISQEDLDNENSKEFDK